MAGKKKEGLKALKDTTGGNRRDDRQSINKTNFELITIDAKNALTVIYMLQSPEENVVLKALASLEGFCKKGQENTKTICALGVFSYLFPLSHHSDNLIKRFALKLLGMLCSLEEFREQILGVENVLDFFVSILEKETDVVLQEFAALILAELSSEYRAASDLLRVTNCINTLFLRITSPDPDVEKNCLDIMNHLLNDVDGIEAFITSSDFDIKLILGLILSSYPTIQALAIEVLKQLTSWCRDNRTLFAFRDAMGIELTLNVLEKDEWFDLLDGALDLLINVADSPELCDYLLQSGCLTRLVGLMNNLEEKKAVEKILGVLARMSQTGKGRLALHAIEIEEKFCSFLRDNYQGFQEQACLGIANLAQNGYCLESIMNINPVDQLLDIAISREKNLDLRNLTTYALNIMCNYSRKAAESLLENDQMEQLFSILIDNSLLSVELCRNLIQVFMGISFYDQLRLKLISEKFLVALISCIQSGDSVDTSIQADALECLSGFLIELEARSLFDSLDGAKVIIDCLHSKFAAIREWAGHLVVISSQSKDFVKSFIQNDGLEWMIKEKNTMYSMPSWQAGIDAIFSNYLPAKFAYTELTGLLRTISSAGRLDLQDITQDGFYISSNPSKKFILLDYFIESRISPLHPIYVASFFSHIGSQSNSETSISHQDQSQSQLPNSKTTEIQNIKKFTKGEKYSQSNLFGDVSACTYPSTTAPDYITIENSQFYLENICPDPYLNEYLEDLKKRIEKAELSCGNTNWQCIHPILIRERARIIGELVADEMSGTEADSSCTCHYTQTHINELKFYLGSNILPLGLIRMGSYLERALLFKVLSDRIGFPCALVRGPYGRSWIEIAIPVINIEDLPEDPEIVKSKAAYRGAVSEIKLSTENSVTNQTSQNFSPTPSVVAKSVLQDEFWFPKLKMECFKAFPENFLKTNAIVDLIQVPGRILPMNSLEAKNYTGAFLFSKNE